MSSLAEIVDQPVNNSLRNNRTSFRISETTDCIRSLSHLRDDFGCWNFLDPKSALNLIATLPMQVCCNQECRTKQDSKNSAGYRRAAIVFFCDNQEA